MTAAPASAGVASTGLASSALASPGLGAGRSPRGTPRRFAILAPSADEVVGRYRRLIESLAASKHAVTCVAPYAEERYAAMLAASGAAAMSLPEPARGFQLFPVRARGIAITERLSKIAPHTVLVLAGPELPAFVLAAKKSTRTRSSDTTSNDPRVVVAFDDRPAAGIHGVRRALEIADAAVFYNGDHAKAWHQTGTIPADLPYTVLPIPGVDLAAGSPAQLPAFGGGLVFLTAADGLPLERLLDYCEAARRVKARAPGASFGIWSSGAGGLDGSAVDRAAFDAYRGTVQFLSGNGDLLRHLAACHVFVHASPGEGMPTTVLEALAAGRPVITTDAPGCRDTVDDRINGCLVTPGDVDQLVAAMETFLKRPDLIPHLARASRAKAERRFARTMVDAAMMKVLGV